MNNKNIRNIAIIAHVRPWKNYISRCTFKTKRHVFRENEQVSERVMDSG